MIAARGDVVALLAEPTTIFERTEEDVDRPLLNGENRLEVIRSLLAERADVYQRAKICVKTDELSVESVVDLICERLGRYGSGG